MPGVSRKEIDNASGKLVGGSANVLINGKGAVREGDEVTTHGTGQHVTPKMTGKSSTVFVNGIGVCRAGDKASCGHVATGSGDVFAG